MTMAYMGIAVGSEMQLTTSFPFTWEYKCSRIYNGNSQSESLCEWTYLLNLQSVSTKNEKKNYKKSQNEKQNKSRVYPVTKNSILN